MSNAAFRLQILARDSGDSHDDFFEYLTDGRWSAEYGASIPIEPLGGNTVLHDALVAVADTLYRTPNAYEIQTCPMRGVVYAIHRNG